MGLHISALRLSSGLDVRFFPLYAYPLSASVDDKATLTYRRKVPDGFSSPYSILSHQLDLARQKRSRSPCLSSAHLSTAFGWSRGHQSGTCDTLGIVYYAVSWVEGLMRAVREVLSASRTILQRTQAIHGN